MTEKLRVDRRVQKTKRSLHEALVSLIREKDYDDIAVREILDRANVGRSTFYAHFDGKHDLLASGIHEMLDTVRSTATPGPRDPFTWFSLPILEHHHRHRSTSPPIGAGGRAVLHEQLGRHLTRMIAADLGRAERRRPARSIPQDLLVRHAVSTFVLVLNWWLESRSALAPAQVDAIFRSLVGPAVDSDA